MDKSWAKIRLGVRLERGKPAIPGGSFESPTVSSVEQRAVASSLPPARKPTELNTQGSKEGPAHHCLLATASSIQEKLPSFRPQEKPQWYCRQPCSTELLAPWRPGVSYFTRFLCLGFRDGVLRVEVVVVKPRLEYVVDFAGWKVCRLRHEARRPLPEVPQGNRRSMEDLH